MGVAVVVDMEVGQQLGAVRPAFRAVTTEEVKDRG